MARNINRMVKAWRELMQHPENVVLATIIETFGSTYQKAGARMIIPETGEYTGLLGGGCFEGDLREQAASLYKDGLTKTVFYDMRSPDDAVWGLGLGCNGAVRVFLQLLTAENHFHPLDMFAEIVNNGRTGVLATVQASTHKDFPAGSCTFLEAKHGSGRLVIDSDHCLFALPASRVLLQEQPELVAHDLDGEKVSVFYDLLKPAPKLLVLGAGPDAVPVTHFAKALGWQVTVADHRPAYARPDRFPDVDRLLNISPDEVNEKLSLDQFDALVLMTHNIEYDEHYIRIIAESSIPYIGLLGPAKRRDRLLDSLGDRAGQISGRVYGPVGLDLGAETPEEIALSIMAEIQAVLKQRDGQPLHLVDLPLQEREKPN